MRVKIICVLLSVALLCSVVGSAGFVGGAETLSHIVYINEICSGNNGGDGNAVDVTDDNGEYCDWIELYNPGSTAVELSGWGVTDKPDRPFKATLGSGTTIAAGGYLVIYCSKTITDDAVPTAAIGISGDGETIKLTAADGVAADIVELPALKNDATYGRYPDGGERLCVMTPTPGATNANAVLTLDSPVFSKDSGIMLDGFELSITTDIPNGEIYYTTDGSDPRDSDTTIKYTAPIPVRDRTGEPNVLSAIPCSEFGPGNSGTRVPADSAVDKATVIRACVKDDAGNCSATVSKTYFVGEKTASYGETALISMVTDRDNLFDYDIGIYCKGAKYDEYMLDHPGEKDYYGTQGNYSQKGSEWERECHIDFFETDGSLAFEQDCGVRIQGGVSRSSVQKSLRFLASAKYGEKYFEHDMFEGAYDVEGNKITQQKSFVLRNGGNDGNTKFSDGYVQSNLTDRAFDTQNTRTSLLFINGEFWGFYILQEDYSEHYIASKYNVDPDNVVIYKNWKIDAGTDEDKALQSELQRFICYRDLTSADNFQTASEMMDLQSFSDYMAAQLYFGNTDWPTGNFAFWRTRTAELGNPYGDCRWRFMLFDTEFCMSLFGNSNSAASYDRITEIVQATWEKPNFIAVMLKNLLTNDSFKAMFMQSFTEIANINFAYRAASARLDAAYRANYKYLQLNCARYSCFHMSEANSRYTRMDDYISQRRPYAMEYMSSALGLSGKTSALTLTASDPSGGSVKTENSEIVFSEYRNSSFTGVFFENYPLTLTAQPYEGYEFVGWSGAVSSTEQTIVLNVNGSMSVVANYQKTTEPTTAQPTTEAPTTTAEATTAGVLYGDCNSDGNVNAKDLLLLRQQLAVWSVAIDLTAADVFYDGEINAKDLLRLRQYLAEYPVTLGPR